MGDRGSLEPAARDGVRPLAWALVVNMLSVHVVTVARTSRRCRPPGRRTLARRVTLAEYALRRTPTTTPAATLCPVQRPRLTFGARVGRRWAAVREPVLDTCVAALLWAGMAVDLSTRPLTEGQSPTSPVAYVVTGLVAAPVVVHRRYPVLAMLLSTTALVGYSLGRFTAYPGYTTFVLVFLVALHADRRRALVVYLGGVVGLSVSLLLQPPAVATASSWISTVLTVTVAWLAGENLRSRRARRRDELDDAHRQVAQKAEEARRAITAERLRIARDLHDVVAHSMSVIAVQAGVAHHVIEERPEIARDALGSIEVTAREGLVEMRRLLGLLRSEGDAVDDSGMAPVEGLRDMDRLLAHFRDAGVRVEVGGPGGIGDLPPALDITAYRIVQEGLTNVLRHGGPVAFLGIERSPTELRIEIRDDGRAPAPATPGSGHGLTGIHERAALFGGTVYAKPQATGGFRLMVELPIDASVVT
jgi:signal transduction histidine kinase